MRYLALDLDGVVLRNHKIHNVVARRAELFVAKKLSVNNMDVAREKNKEMYSKWGHTMLGLRKHGVHVTTKEYNNFVYGDMDYEELFEDFEDTHNDDIIALNLVMSAAKRADLHTLVFSNAPDFYVHEVMKRMLQPMDHKEYLSVGEITDGYLKPDINAYRALEDALKPSINKEAKFVLVDDTYINLFPVMTKQSWNTVWITDKTDISSGADSVLKCRDLEALAHVLCPQHAILI